VVSIAAEPVLPAGEVRRGVARVAEYGQFSEALGADLGLLGGGSYENCFTLAAKSGTGV
jgi:hypothetical protein